MISKQEHRKPHISHTQPTTVLILAILIQVTKKLDIKVDLSPLKQERKWSSRKGNPSWIVAQPT